jgi:hypothetical protein
MKAQHIERVAGRLILAALLAVLPAACAFIEGPLPANPLLGSWSNADNDRVSFQPNTVVVSPKDGKPVAMGPGDCNGIFKLSYGRMATANFATLFPLQPDLEAKLKGALVKPEYPVADVTCDRGGTTYLMLDDHQVLAIYRDSGIGGLEHLTRL